VRDGEYDAVVLAAAGLRRLGLEESITEVFDVDRVLPDAGQGIVAVQTRLGSEAQRRCNEVDDRAARLAALAERALVRALGADCHSPVGALAEVEGEMLALRGMAALPDGRRVARAAARARTCDPVSLGRDVAALLLEELRA
jgi:hydroxymethylbilane synthase